MAKRKVALFIGRFQPFHKGHLYSLRKALEIAEKVTILVAKSNVSGTMDDPWDYRLRKRMVCEVVRKEELADRVERICSCPDYPSDRKWVGEVKKRAGEFDVVVSNNKWVLDLMRVEGYEVFESGLFNRDELEGVKIREMIRKGDMGWKERVSKEVVEIIS